MELDTPWGNFKIGPLTHIEVGLAQCKSYRDLDDTQALRDNIEAYEYVLRQPNAKELAMTYAHWQQKKGGLATIAEAAKDLGWF